MKPARRCSTVGCGRNAIAGGRCAEHPRQAWNAGTVTRIRGRELQTRRNRLFAAAPLCVVCELAGRVTLATVRDHIRPLAEGGSEDEHNIQPMCQACSDLKTQTEAARGRRRLDAG
jgi:5-methylcytosine-specific restriction enzyme A